MRIVFAGTPQVALPSLEAVLASPHEVVAVVTRPDAPAGRGRHLVASPVGERAAAEGITVLKPPSPRDPEFIEQLRDLAPECCPVVAYGALVPQPALDVPVPTSTRFLPTRRTPGAIDGTSPEGRTGPSLTR